MKIIYLLRLSTILSFIYNASSLEYIISTHYLLEKREGKQSRELKTKGNQSSLSIILPTHGGDSLLIPAKYCSVVGALQYLSLHRPYTSLVLNNVIQFMDPPITVLFNVHVTTFLMLILIIILSDSSCKQPSPSLASTESEYKVLRRLA